jgi:transcriptional regulator with XRE-family HTH domain
MERQGITNSVLAERIGTSKAYITKVFGGNANFTLQTMVKLSRALGGNLHVHVVEQEAKVRWIDIYDGKMKTIKHDVETVEIDGPKKTTGNWAIAQELLSRYKAVSNAEA